MIQADKNDTVEQLHHIIELKTKNPAKKHYLVYQGKQLQLEHSLSDYSIEQDSSLHLLARVESKHAFAWQLADKIMYKVSRMLKGIDPDPDINEILITFFS